MVVIPHRSGHPRIENKPRTQRRDMPVAEELIVIHSVPCRVKRFHSPVGMASRIDRAAFHVVLPAFISLDALSFPSGFANRKHVTWGYYLCLRSYAGYPPWIQCLIGPAPQPKQQTTRDDIIGAPSRAN